MVRRVFFSFHFDADGWRAAQVRNIGKLEADNPVSDNEWEQVKKGGDKAIQTWIDGQMKSKSCCVVLVGAQTAERKWVKYEIKESWNAKRAVVGIRIHNLKDRSGNITTFGTNPFESFNLGDKKLSSIVKLHDPIGWDSKSVYQNIADNIDQWVEDAIALRSNYKS